MFEITVKDINNFKEIQQIIKLVKDFSIDHLSITNKSKDFTSLSVAKLIRDNLDCSIKISCNYSIQMNLQSSIDLQVKHLNNFIEECAKLDIHDVLVVSGNQNKILTHQIINNVDFTKIDLSVAFNPFFENHDDYLAECSRLSIKLTEGNVKYVYLQLSENTNRLKNGILFLKKNYPNVNVIASILLPTKYILNKLKFRRWRGVFYSDEYLNNINFAIQNSQDQIKMCKKFAIGILYVVYPFYKINDFCFDLYDA